MMRYSDKNGNITFNDFVACYVKLKTMLSMCCFWLLVCLYYVCMWVEDALQISSLCFVIMYKAGELLITVKSCLCLQNHFVVKIGMDKGMSNTTWMK